MEISRLIGILLAVELSFGELSRFLSNIQSFANLIETHVHHSMLLFIMFFHILDMALNNFDFLFDGLPQQFLLNVSFYLSFVEDVTNGLFLKFLLLSCLCLFFFRAIKSFKAIHVAELHCIAPPSEVAFALWEESSPRFFLR